MADEEEAVLTVGVWEVYVSQGRPYFFKNDGSETTQWEVPEELRDDPRVQELLVEEEDEEGGGGGDGEVGMLVWKGGNGMWMDGVVWIGG